MFTRRRFLQSSAVAASGSLVGCASIKSSPNSTNFRPGKLPRNIIHLVADGTSSGMMTCGDHFSMVKRGRGLLWHALFKRPNSQIGLMDMRSLNSLVTDSSAASSSWGSGTRIINGVVNQAGDGTPLKTLYELLGAEGWKRGLVTTTEITHATPAGFAACAESRDKASIIAAQYLDRTVEVLLGGGAKHFDPAWRLDKRNLKRDFANAGYAILETESDLSAAPMDKRWLGTFSRSHLPFDVDRPLDPKARTVPSLATMTRAALKKLENSDRFILQVEGGRVDHGCHNADVVAAMHEVLSFDEAIDVCLAFQKEHPDTLLVITTDHATANPALNGTGDGYGQSTWAFRNATKVQASFPELLKRFKIDPDTTEAVEKDDEAEKKKEAAKSKEQKDREKAEKKAKDEAIIEPKEIAKVIQDLTGYKVSEKLAGMLRPHVQKKGESLYDMMKGDTPALGHVMANYHALSFTGTAHTSDFVPILALGPGSERFRGFIKNTDVFYHYLAFAKIDFRNPQEPLIGDFTRTQVTMEDTESYKRVARIS